jgi:hypothetical protein
MQRVTNVSASAEPRQRQEQVRVGLLRNADSNRSESQNVNLPSGAQTSARHQVHFFQAPKDPTGEKATYNAKVDSLLRANSNKSESQNVELASVVYPSAGQQVYLPPPSKDPQGEKIRYQAKADLLCGANSNRSESQIVDLPNVAHPSSEQQVHLSPPSKDPPASGQSLVASAPGVTKTSRQMQDTAPGEAQAPHVETPPEVPVCPIESGESAPPGKKGGRDPLNRQQAPNDTVGVTKTRPSGLTQDTAPGESQAPLERTPHEVPVYPNASREYAPPEEGGHDPLNGQRAPNDVSSPLVRHPPAAEPPPRCQSSPQPPSITTHAYYVPYLQAADHSTTPPLPTAWHCSPPIRSNAVPMRPTPPMAVSQRRNEATGPAWSEQQEQSKEKGALVHIFCCASNGATKTLCC